MNRNTDVHRDRSKGWYFRALCVELILLTAAGCPVPASADVAQKVRPNGYRTVRQIVLPGLPAATMVYLPLDEHALAGVKSESEYRILDAVPAEVPYRMLPERGQTESYALEAAAIYNSPPAARPQELLVDARSHPAFPLVLHLTLSGAKQAVVASVDGSTDRKEWRKLGQAKAVPAPGSTVDDVTVRVNRTADRYYRIRIVPLGEAIPRIAWHSFNVETLVERVAVPVPATVNIHPGESQDTLLELDPGRAVRDLDEIRLYIDDPSFDRPVSYEESENGREWSPSGWNYRMGAETGFTGEPRITRLAGTDPIRLILNNPPPDNYTHSVRRLRLVIHNGNDRPLSIRKVEIFRSRRGLVFQADPGQQYSLVYGKYEETNTLRPDYEIARMPLIEPPARLPLASLGPARELPPPWSEQHPVLLWSALALVVAVLVSAILRSMRSAARTGA